MSNTSENFYEQSSFPAIEKVTLAEDLTFKNLSDIEGKFFMDLMTPTMDTDYVIERDYGKYQKTNYINLTIPAYLLLSFMKGEITMSGSGPVITFPTSYFTIPKGTEFTAAFIGGIPMIERLSILGVYFNDEEE